MRNSKIITNRRRSIMAVDTDIFFKKEDVNKNLYRKKTYYTLVIEQEVIAKNKDEADKLF
jgi:hypothetical protein